MLRLLLVSLLVLGVTLLAAQQPTATSPKSETATLPVGTHPNDLAKVAAAIRDSYYHPDEMSGLDCTVSLDWPAFFSALKLNPAADRLKAIQDVKIRSQATRGKKTGVTFKWASGSLDNKEQFEDGINQMLGGFYQMYWNIVASSPLSNAAEISKIEPLSDGGAKVYSSGQNTNLVIITDKENTPTHYTFDSPAMSGTIDLHYVASPKPVPSDLRRISGIDTSEQIGTSTMNVKLSLDYQAVDEFYVPRHVSFDLVGAYSVLMDFSVCSVSKGAIAH
jgi:hypothetical protein